MQLLRGSFLILASTLACCATSSPAPAPVAAATSDPVRRLAAILDYVAADYAGAVRDGEIASHEEYAEQLGFLDDARAMLDKLPARDGAATRQARLASLRASVEAFAPAPDVATAARALRKDFMSAYGVVVAPTSAPLRERGRDLYASNCATCHGATGGADGPMAAALHPPPRRFLDPDTMAAMSPVRAFNALTDGLPGTAMSSFGQLPAADRWNLAFYIFTLRQPPDVVARGEAAARAARDVSTTPSTLADTTDAELMRRFAAAGLDASHAADAVAYARGAAVYRQSGAPFDAARQLLAAANTAYRGGNHDGARQLASSAYLDGVEPHEPALAAVDPAGVRRLEDEFLALRQAIADRSDPDRIEQRVLRIDALLDEADRRLAGSGGAQVAFVTAAVIVVREGFEAALLILLLFGIARRSGAEPRDLRAIHLGWLTALAVGVLVWFASGAVLSRLGGASREVLEGGVSLFAAVVLLAVSHFVLARHDAKRRVDALKQRLDQASTAANRRRFVLASLAFVAVFREAFEVVLFLRAVMLDASVSSWPIAGGVAAGVVAVAGLAIVAARLGKRLRPGMLLTAMGTLLCVLAVMLAGKGVRALQEAGTIAIRPIHGPRADWFGIYPTLQTTLAQAFVLAAFAALAGWPIFRGRLRAGAPA